MAEVDSAKHAAHLGLSHDEMALAHTAAGRLLEARRGDLNTPPTVDKIVSEALDCGARQVMVLTVASLIADEREERDMKNPNLKPGE